MIPNFNINGELPEGIHEATLDEVKVRFCYNFTRKEIFNGFLSLLKEFEKIDCKDIYIDGSFTTIKDLPKDIDICWGNLDMMNDDFINHAVHKAEKLFLSENKLYNCEFYPSFCKTIYKKRQIYYIELFQISKKNEKAKGIIKLNIQQND